MIPKTIVLHDYFRHAEGGGRLSRIAADGLQADLGYGFARLPHPFVQGGAQNPREHSLNVYSPIPLWQQFRLAHAFQTRPTFLQAYDCIIYSGFYTPLAIKHNPTAKHIYYCHTPPRFIYDQYDFYQRQLPAPLRPLLNAFIRYLQPRYEAAVAQMDVILTNSHNVQRRIQTHLGHTAHVIYPPCDTQRFVWQGQQDYYLSTARLDPLKRVDCIVQAFLRMPDKRLVVASSGSEQVRLQKLAQHASNITFTGYQTDAELADLVGNAIATVYLPQDEDFGMSPVESMAAGKPVIGVAAGGLLESITPPTTGILLAADPTIKEICAAVQRLTPEKALNLRVACETRAQQFNQSIFIERMREVVY